jgi:hypothetical protein
VKRSCSTVIATINYEIVEEFSYSLHDFQPLIMLGKPINLSELISLLSLGWIFWDSGEIKNMNYGFA